MNVWIIIATLNRPNELRRFTLSSLLEQDCKGFFKVIVWDASKDNATEEMVRSIPDLEIDYHKAPRRGLAQQRNDAISYVKQIGDKKDLIIFLDDDVVLSKDAVSGVIQTFEKEDIYGVGIPIIGEKRISRWLTFIPKLLFLNLIYNKRHMTSYCYQYKPAIEKNGVYVNWFSGCGMAYRMMCFDSFTFEEKLSLFGGYCLGEDALFSYQVWKKFKGLRLSLFGSLHHMKCQTARIDFESLVASHVYNRRIIFKAINERKKAFCIFFASVAYKWNSLYVFASLGLKAIADKSFKSFKTGLKKGKKHE